MIRRERLYYFFSFLSINAIHHVLVNICKVVTSIDRVKLRAIENDSRKYIAHYIVARFEARFRARSGKLLRSVAHPKFIAEVSH